MQFGSPRQQSKGGLKHPISSFCFLHGTLGLILLDIWIELRVLFFFFFVLVRFVRFVSNPDVLERVYTLETEIKQIKEAIGIQNNSEIALPVVSKLLVFFFLKTLFGVWSNRI